MQTIIRYNPSGVRYSLNENSDGSTTIIKSDSIKFVKVNQSIDKLNGAWYNWTMKSELIQNAFPFLTGDEREFLITGITPEEWQKLFSEEKE